MNSNGNLRLFAFKLFVLSFMDITEKEKTQRIDQEGDVLLVIGRKPNTEEKTEVQCVVLEVWTSRGKIRLFMCIIQIVI